MLWGLAFLRDFPPAQIFPHNSDTKERPWPLKFLSEVQQFAQMMDDGSSMMDHYNDDVCIDDSDVGFDMFCRCRLKSKMMMKKEEEGRWRRRTKWRRRKKKEHEEDEEHADEETYEEACEWWPNVVLLLLCPMCFTPLTEHLERHCQDLGASASHGSGVPRIFFGTAPKVRGH